MDLTVQEKSLMQKVPDQWKSLLAFLLTNTSVKRDQVLSVAAMRYRRQMTHTAESWDTLLTALSRRTPVIDCDGSLSFPCVLWLFPACFTTSFLHFLLRFHHHVSPDTLGRFLNLPVPHSCAPFVGPLFQQLSAILAKRCDEAGVGEDQGEKTRAPSVETFTRTGSQGGEAKSESRISNSRKFADNAVIAADTDQTVSPRPTQEMIGIDSKHDATTSDRTALNYAIRSSVQVEELWDSDKHTAQPVELSGKLASDIVDTVTCLCHTTDTDTVTPPCHTTDTDTVTPPCHTTDTDTVTPLCHTTDTDTVTRPCHTTDTDTVTPPCHTTDTDTVTRLCHTTDTDTVTRPCHTTDSDTVTRLCHTTDTDTVTRPCHTTDKDAVKLEKPWQTDGVEESCEDVIVVEDSNDDVIVIEDSSEEDNDVDGDEGDRKGMVHKEGTQDKQTEGQWRRDRGVEGERGSDDGGMEVWSQAAGQEEEGGGGGHIAHNIPDDDHTTTSGTEFLIQTLREALKSADTEVTPRDCDFLLSIPPSQVRETLWTVDWGSVEEEGVCGAVGRVVQLSGRLSDAVVSLVLQAILIPLFAGIKDTPSRQLMSCLSDLTAAFPLQVATTLCDCLQHSPCSSVQYDVVTSLCRNWHGDTLLVFLRRLCGSDLQLTDSLLPVVQCVLGQQPDLGSDLLLSLLRLMETGAVSLARNAKYGRMVLNFVKSYKNQISPSHAPSLHTITSVHSSVIRKSLQSAVSGLTWS
ncbi:uncharacterized protein LOC143277904 isoform X2 [Babylonia areolata]|uniref:uncharacterized protein LOC143277904 isoform X2 n=1 Tax=Babylonia areolata TaxID=304850 RepID=UPI003FD07062